MRIIFLAWNWLRDRFCQVSSILETMKIFLVAGACTWKHQLGKIQDPVASFADPFHLGNSPSCVFRKMWGMSAFHPFCFSGKCYKVVQVTKKLLGWWCPCLRSLAHTGQQWCLETKYTQGNKWISVYTKDISDLLRQVLCKCCNTWLKASAYQNTLKSLDIT